MTAITTNSSTRVKAPRAETQLGLDKRRSMVFGHPAGARRPSHIRSAQAGTGSQRDLKGSAGLKEPCFLRNLSHAEFRRFRAGRSSDSRARARPAFSPAQRGDNGQNRTSNPSLHSVTAAGPSRSLTGVPCLSALQRKWPTTNAQCNDAVPSLAECRRLVKRPQKLPSQLVSNLVTTLCVVTHAMDALRRCIAITYLYCKSFRLARRKHYWC